MDADRYARALEVFLAISGLPEPAQAAAIERACAGDPELLAEVKSVLQHHSNESLLPARPPERTRVARVDHVSFNEGAAGEWTEEQRRFLQQRVRVLAIIFSLIVSHALIRAVVFLGVRPALATWLVAGMIAGWALLLGLSTAAFLLRTPSRAALRRVELGIATCALLVIFNYGYAWLTMGASIAGSPSRELQDLFAEAHWVVSSDKSAVHFKRGSSLVSNPIVSHWTLLAAFYGLVVPNTPRRGAVMLIAWLVSSEANLLAAAARSPAFGALLVPNALSCFFAVAVIGSGALYAGLKFQALRRAAWRAMQVGQYRLTRLLGSGAMGEVYLAEHRLLRRPCAVKLIRPERAGSQDWLKRFEREVQAMAQLTHPNTVEIYDFGRTEDGSFFYAMEYLPGVTLDALVREHGPLPPGRAVYFIRQVCGALSEAHRKGMVHRDIKPGNIIICERGGHQDVVKLLDFGIVYLPDADAGRAAGSRDRAEEPGAASMLELTGAGQILGTPAYMSPEQVRGEQPDARSDIYSLGVVACVLLTGKPPFEVETLASLFSAHLEAPAPRLRDRAPDVPDDLDAVIARCLAKERGDRFQSVSEVAAALDATGAAGEWDNAKADAWWRERSVSADARRAVGAAGAISGARVSGEVGA